MIISDLYCLLVQINVIAVVSAVLMILIFNASVKSVMTSSSGYLCLFYRDRKHKTNNS